MARFVHADGLALSVGMDQVDAAQAHVAVAAREPEVRHLDAALRAEDAQHIVLVERDAAGDLGNDAARKMQQRRGPFIDAGLAEMRHAGHLVRLGERFSRSGPGDEARHRNRIAADVQNAAAGEIVGIEPVLRHEARHRKAKARLDHADFADDARFDQFHQFQRLRVQPVHEGFAEKRAGLARRMDHRVGLEGGQPHRLFAKHMLACFRRLDCPFGMTRMRRRNIDRVDLRIRQQSIVACEDARTGEVLGKPGLAGVARAYRDQRRGLRTRDATGKGFRDAARRENSPAGSCGRELMFVLRRGFGRGHHGRQSWLVAVSAAAVPFRRKGRICGLIRSFPSDRRASASRWMTSSSPVAERGIDESSCRQDARPRRR